MDKDELPRMSLRGITPESNSSKEIRIRAIEPYGSTLAVHCKKSHTDFIKEWVNYVPNDRFCKKDLLDALAYQVQVARPGVPQAIPRLLPEGQVYVGISMDAVLDELLKPVVTSPFEDYSISSVKAFSGLAHDLDGDNLNFLSKEPPSSKGFLLCDALGNPIKPVKPDPNRN